MQTFIKHKFITLSIAIIAIIFIISNVSAGSLSPSSSATSTMYSLSAIYQKLTTGTTTLSSGELSTTTPASPTQYTLETIYNALPEWLTLSNSTTTIQSGYYEQTNLSTIDTDLTASNIATGTVVFGIHGQLPIDDSDGVTIKTQWSTTATSGPATYDENLAFCTNLEEDGYTDWDAPDVLELHYAYLTNISGFSTSYLYITKTVSVDEPSQFFYADFRADGGSMISFSKSFVSAIQGSGLMKTRCVR